MWLRKFDERRPTVNIDWRERIFSAINQTFGFVDREEHLVQSDTWIIGTSNALQLREESSGFNSLLYEIFKRMRSTRLNVCFEKGIEKSKLAFFNHKNYKKLRIKSLYVKY